jgi:MFS family permease
MHAPAETASRTVRAPGAQAALALLLTINLFNFIDRYVLAAVLPKLRRDAELFDPTDHLLGFKLGLLTSVFVISYTVLSPVFGWFGDGVRRWWVVGIGVTLWSLASGGSGLATSYLVLLLTRCLVGVGEAAYGPVAPSMLADLYPIKSRGKVMALLYMAIPVGSALGFVIGGQMGEHFGWRAAFLVTLAGLLLGGLCFVMKEPPRSGGTAGAPRPRYRDVLRYLRGIPSFVYCCAGMTATTFILGGVAAWAPTYIMHREGRFELTPEVIARFRNDPELKTSTGEPVVPDAVVAKLEPLAGTGSKSFDEFKALLLDRLGESDLKQYGERIYETAPAEGSITLGGANLIFGVIIFISGLGATLLGGVLGDKLRERGVRGAYFKAAGWTTIAAFPFFLAMLYVPFPYAWACFFVAVFFLFFNTGPANTILANVTRSEVRATAFAINILVIHLLGDVISPPIIGLISDVSNLHYGLLFASFFILLGGGLWVLGAKHLDADTAKAEAGERPT